MPVSDDDDDSDPDDSWFDSLVDRKLDDLLMSESLIDGLLPQDSQGMPEDFETPPQTPSKDDDIDSKVVSVRPVARPLNNWDDPILADPMKIETSDAMVVDDSPPRVPQPFLTDAATLRAQRIAFLKAQLAELESSQEELASAGWGPGLQNDSHILSFPRFYRLSRSSSFFTQNMRNVNCGIVGVADQHGSTLYILKPFRSKNDTAIEMEVKPTDSNEVWLVNETVPYASDVDPTLAMELPDGTIPTSVAESLQHAEGMKQEKPEEKNTEEPPPKENTTVEVPEIPEKARCFQKFIKARNFHFKNTSLKCNSYGCFF